MHERMTPERLLNLMQQIDGLAAAREPMNRSICDQRSADRTNASANASLHLPHAGMHQATERACMSYRRLDPTTQSARDSAPP